MNQQLILRAAFLSLIAGTFQTVNAQLTITPTYDNSITSLSDSAAIEASIQADINTLESDVTTGVADSVTIEFQNINTGLGESLTPQADLDYSTYLADLQANTSKSSNDTTALATMPAGNAGIQGDAQVLLTAADLAALGDSTDANSLKAGNGGFNSVISLNLSIINVTRPDSNPDNYDLQSVAMHEMDEVLGIGGNASTLYQAGATPPSSLPTDVGPLDFFRYSGVGVRSFTYNASTSAYFSINGGTNNLVYFNQQNGNNGSDFGDWGNPAGDASGNTPEQVQDAFGTPGGQANIGPNELTALDVIGYNLTPVGQIVDGIAVPEPSTYISVILGGLAVFGLRLRRRNGSS